MIEDNGKGGKQFDIKWDKNLDGVDCTKMRNAINDAKIKSSGNICVTTGAYPKSQVQVWEIDPADAGKMNGVLAGLFPDVKPNCT